MKRQLSYWALLSLLFYLAFVLWSKIPFWIIILLAPLLALIVLHIFSLLTARRKKQKTTVCDHKFFAAEALVHNQAFDPSKTPRCPHCHKDDVSKMIYGKPALNRQIIEGLESGRIISGGCMIHGGAPEWHCNQCNRDFGHLKFDPE